VSDGLTFDQTNRYLKLELDGTLSHTLLPLQFQGREAVSELFSYTVDLVSANPSQSADDLLGHDLTIIVTVEAGLERRFTGTVIRFSPGPLWGADRNLRTCQVELAPKLWLATLNARCRSFTSQSALDIVESVLGEYSITDSKRGQGAVTRDSRDYCLQYCESDFNFISRLLEQEGIFYYFGLDHQNNSIVLVDGINGSFEVSSDALAVGTHQIITGWAQDYRTVPQSVTYSGYDFKQASIVSQTAQATTKLSYASQAKIEAYPSNTIDTPRSQFFADMTMQQREKDYETYRGESTYPKIAPGGRFTVGGGDDVIANNKSVMVLEAVHHATDYTHISGEGGEPTYSNSFLCCPLDTKYRPPLRAQIPVIHGIQTATVADDDPDEYGRVKVKYHWGSQLESWWARIAMPWAHNQMGFQFFPRKGAEVVIEFLEGNPERPVIVGALYNGVKKVIYTLPANVTQSGMRGTDPDKTGAAESFNELQFEDKSGSEFIKFFAQKDFNRVVVNNDTLEVRNGNRDVTLKSGNLTTVLDQGNETRQLKTGNLELKLDQGDQATTLSMGNQTLKLDMGNQNVTLSMGNQTTKLDLGAASTEAMQSITLKVGQSSVTIDQMGVTIQGMMIKINGQVQTQVQGLMTQISGSAMTQISGGITMIG
jgi:type VI secretion system secreted protein VgrG